MQRQLYDKLTKTAMAFIDSCRPNPAGSNKPDAEAILANLDGNHFRIDWGHKTLVTTKPALQGHKSGQEFVEHMSKMAPGLETWAIEIRQVIVDPIQRTAMVRAEFFMVPLGSGLAEERTVLNDIILTFAMDQTGEKILAATEFIDPVASAEIGRLMAANKPDYV